MSLSLSLVALLFPIASHHYVTGDDHFREVNPGIIAELKSDTGVTYEAGLYANSVGKTTVTVQRRFTGAQSYWFNIGARLGVCTGYRFAVIPCGGASIRVGQYVDLMFVPPVHNMTPAVTALTFRMPL